MEALLPEPFAAGAFVEATAGSLVAAGVDGPFVTGIVMVEAKAKTNNSDDQHRVGDYLYRVIHQPWHLFLVITITILPFEKKLISLG
jgi:hypothetical protein